MHIKSRFQLLASGALGLLLCGCRFLLKGSWMPE